MARRPLALALAAGALLAAAAPASAYVRTRTDRGSGVPIAWDRRCVPFHINERGNGKAAFTQLETAIRRSFAAWQNVQCSDLELHYQGTTNAEQVGFNPKGKNINLVVFRGPIPCDEGATCPSGKCGEEGVCLGSENAWTHEAKIIALTTVTFCSEESGAPCDRRGKILDADIEMNGDDFAFTTSPLPGRVLYDIQNTVTHEAGHFLGLDHSLEPTATMYATAPAGERSKQTLASDDIAGLCEIAPHVTPVAACEAFEVTGNYLVEDPWSGESSSGSDSEPSACSAVAGKPVHGAGLLLLALPGIPLLRARRRAHPGRQTHVSPFSPAAPGPARPSLWCSPISVSTYVKYAFDRNRLRSARWREQFSGSRRRKGRNVSQSR